MMMSSFGSKNWLASRVTVPISVHTRFGSTLLDRSSDRRRSRIAHLNEFRISVVGALSH